MRIWNAVFFLGFEELGDQSVVPAHKRNENPLKRLESFKKDPKFSTMNIEEMADAGFYYAGTGDMVRCYWCDGSLEGWKEHDDPWEEHAK